MKFNLTPILIPYLIPKEILVLNYLNSIIST